MPWLSLVSRRFVKEVTGTRTCRQPPAGALAQQADLPTRVYPVGDEIFALQHLPDVLDGRADVPSDGELLQGHLSVSRWLL